MWLLVHFGTHNFDVRVVDTYLCPLMGLFENFLEKTLKQNVYLSKIFRVLVENSRTMTKIYQWRTDSDMMKVWWWGLGKDTIKVWEKEIASPW